ncbi:hypothetical protein NE237_016824 [Protea cynaroides]|uniref:Uncharacterized protein n=1 Tax=Protea cynaroides TaxID=273540 RepID=A0A9Q0HHW1_9MAGN|nr:hypothetical protein NE237_016824 [Protea cynaroides]
MALEAKNKLGFVDGIIPKPEAPSTDLPYWIRCNSMVQSWLVHSTIPSIANSILWIIDAHANTPPIFEICRAIFNCTQGTNVISTYYINLKGFWNELSSYRKLPTCSCGALNDLSTTIEIDHLMNFLQNLNDSYSKVLSQILLMEPLPQINKAYSLLLQEECQCTITNFRQQPTDQSAMAAQRAPSCPKP